MTIMASVPRAADVVIVGGGTIGAWTAWFLKQAGIGEVVLLERYASRAAPAAHRETAHFKDLVLGQIVPRLDSRVVELYDVE